MNTKLYNHLFYCFIISSQQEADVNSNAASSFNFLVNQDANKQKE